MTGPDRTWWASSGLSPHTAGIGSHHGLSRLARERLLKFGHIAHHAVDPFFPRRMRIGLRSQAQPFFALVLAPDLAKRQEEALFGRKAVDLLLILAADSIEQGHESDADAAIVGGVFAQCQLAVQVNTGHRGE